MTDEQIHAIMEKLGMRLDENAPYDSATLEDGILVLDPSVWIAVRTVIRHRKFTDGAIIFRRLSFVIPEELLHD